MTNEYYILSLRRLNQRIAEIKNAAFADLQRIFRNMTIPQIKEIIQDSHEKVLNFLLDISIITEDYKICEAVRLVKKERSTLKNQ